MKNAQCLVRYRAARGEEVVTVQDDDTFTHLVILGGSRGRLHDECW
jgi:hypothetical protein